MIMLVMVN